ncbi:MAG: hypothetical protein HS105_10925 [Chloracidobacterium sp.]|nr:hypothetical protein [Chloracidobacterium sp.]MCO5332836.1 hypothetical protein [Pyrinomonadaceae bacterium]
MSNDSLTNFDTTQTQGQKKAQNRPLSAMARLAARMKPILTGNHSPERQRRLTAEAVRQVQDEMRAEATEVTEAATPDEQM